MAVVTREATDTLTGGGGAYASWDNPGMAVVTREFTDTLTGGGGGGEW